MEQVLEESGYTDALRLDKTPTAQTRLEDLAAHDTVLLENIEGNIHSINSGAATILAPISYEGTVWVKGQAKGGCLGFLTRLATLAKFSIYLEDNQSMIASDFYIEQGLPQSITLRGSAGLAPGRVTLSLPKYNVDYAPSLTTTDLMNIENYSGEVNFVATQLYQQKAEAQILVGGELPAIQFLGSVFSLKSFATVPSNLKINMLTTATSNPFNTTAVGSLGGRHVAAAAINALLDLRRLGELDWQLNYPELLKRKTP